MTKTDFEKYLEKTLKEIGKKYVKIYGKEKVYLSMFIVQDEEGTEMDYSANNNHWELPEGYKLDRMWREKNE